MQLTRQTLLTLIAAALVLAPAAIAAEYEFETLDAVSPGNANDINNRGQIVGGSGGSGFLIDGGTVTEIAYPGADSTVAFGNNDLGLVVGRYSIGDENFGFVYDDGVFTPIDFPDAVGNSYAFGINNRGDVIGLWCEEKDDPPCAFSPGADGDAIRGWLLDKDGFSNVDFPDAVDTFALRITDNGAIAGQYYDATTGFAFTRGKDGTWNTLVVPGATESEAHGINNRGDVVGLYFADPFDIRGFLKEKEGGFVDIDVPRRGVHRGVQLQRRGRRRGLLLRQRLRLHPLRRLSRRGAVGAEPGRAIEAGLVRFDRLFCKGRMERQVVVDLHLLEPKYPD